MNNKDRNLLYRLSRCISAKKVSNPADIKEKLKFYGEQEKISSCVHCVLMDLIDPQATIEDKEDAIIQLEKDYKRITKQNRHKEQ